MADLNETLQTAVSTLDGVGETELLPSVQVRARALSQLFKQRIAPGAGLAVAVDAHVLDQARQHLERMGEAFDVKDFDRGFGHADAMLGVLPGDPQTGQKPPPPPPPHHINVLSGDPLTGQKPPPKR